jgi:flagellar biosynthesis/type III secretory pathway protein FliH
MNLSPAYLKQRQEWKEEGMQEGRQRGSLEGQLSLITSLLEGRFGSLDAELSGLVEQIAQLPSRNALGYFFLWLIYLAQNC